MTVKALLIYCFDIERERVDGYLCFPDPPEVPAAWQTLHWCETPLQQSGRSSVGSAAAAECLWDADTHISVCIQMYCQTFVFCLTLAWHCRELGLNFTALLHLCSGLCCYIWTGFTKYPVVGSPVVLPWTACGSQATNQCIPQTPDKTGRFGDALPQLSSRHNLALVKADQILKLANFSCS